MDGFEIFDFKNVVTLKPGSKVTQGHQNRHGSIRHLWLPTYNNHEPISFRFRDKRRFQLKIAIFHPVYLTPPLKGFPLKLDMDRRKGSKN